MNTSLLALASSTSPADPMGPPRLADAAGSDYERRLLQSARLDGVPDGAAAKMAAALGSVLVPGANAVQTEVPTGPMEPALSGKASAVNGAVRLGKHWAAGLLGMSVLGAVVAGWWLWAPGGLEPAHKLPALAAPSSVPAGAIAALELESAPAENAPGKSAVEEGVTPAAAAFPRRSSAPKRNARSEVEAVAAPTAPPEAGLLAEVRALEAIQAALDAGQPHNAARALEQYRRRFPQGELALEADVLEVDVALAQGERDKAAEQARTLMARPAASRYRARLRTLIEADLVDHHPTPLGVGSNDTAPHIRGQR